MWGPTFHFSNFFSFFSRVHCSTVDSLFTYFKSKFLLLFCFAFYLVDDISDNAVWTANIFLFSSFSPNWNFHGTRMETVLNPNENFLRLKRLTRKARANSRHEVVVQFSLRRTHTPIDDRLDKWSCVWRARNVNVSFEIVLINSTSASLTFLITSNATMTSSCPQPNRLWPSRKKIVERSDRFRGNYFCNFPRLIHVFLENL